MATAQQLKALLESYSDADGEMFVSVALQIAAHEARGGKGKLASDQSLLDLGSLSRVIQNLVNAPMVQIFSDTYEDLTSESFERVLEEFAAGRQPKPGPQVDRRFSAPVGGPTTLTDSAIYDKHDKQTGGGDEATLPPARAGRPNTSSEETAPGLKGPEEKGPPKLRGRKPQEES